MPQSLHFSGMTPFGQDSFNWAVGITFQTVRAQVYAMTHAYASPSHNYPSLDDISQMAEQAFAQLPKAVQIACDRVVFRVADYADAETLSGLGLTHPLQLAGLYRGVSVRAEIANSGHLPPPEVWLYRQAILQEWRSRGDVSLSEMVNHVLVHEIGHHMGLSDDDIDRLEAIDD